MYCHFCNAEHRSLLEPGGGDSCDPFAAPDLRALPIDMQVIEAEARKQAS